MVKILWLKEFKNAAYGMKCPYVPLSAKGYKQCCAVVSSCLSSPSLPLHCLSSLSLWAHVCFCSRLQPAWLTTMILTKRMERSRLDRQIASEQSALSLCANSVSSLSLSLSPSLHRSIFFLFSISVFTWGETCIREDWQQEWGVCPALKSWLWPAAGWELGTWKH